MESMNDQSITVNLPQQMIFRDEFVDTDQRYLLSFLGALFMQHMAHFLCHYYTTIRPLYFDFIDFPALLYDKTETFASDFVYSLRAFYAPFFYQYREPPVIWLLLRSYIRRHTHTQMNQGPEPVPESPRRLNR